MYYHIIIGNWEVPICSSTDPGDVKCACPQNTVGDPDVKCHGKLVFFPKQYPTVIKSNSKSF